MTVEPIYATLLRVPDLRGAVRQREIPLKGLPIDYLVQQHHGWWMVDGHQIDRRRDSLRGVWSG